MHTSLHIVEKCAIKPLISIILLMHFLVRWG